MHWLQMIEALIFAWVQVEQLSIAVGQSMQVLVR